MTFKEISLVIISILTLFSCKQEKQIDYTLLKGHWLVDSIYSLKEETTLVDPYSDKFKKTKRVYSFSEDMFFINEVDSFIRTDSYFLKMQNREYEKRTYFYSVKNDSIQTYSLDSKKYNEGEFNLKRNWFDLKCEHLEDSFLVLRDYHSLLYLSKTDETSKVKSKKDVLREMNTK